MPRRRSTLFSPEDNQAALNRRSGTDLRICHSSIMAISRKFPTAPLLGVSALCYRDDKVLLIKRGKSPYEGHWSLPGGLVELGEPLLQAANRELMEETGITATLSGPFDVFDSIHHDKRGAVVSHFVLAVFAGPYLAGSLVPADDAADGKWIETTELDRMRTTPGTPDRIRRILQKRPITAP